MGKKELKKNYFDIEADDDEEEDESFDPEEIEGEESGKKDDLTNVEEVGEDEEEEEDDEDEVDERELNYKRRLMDEAEEGSAEEGNIEKYDEDEDLAEDGEDLYDEDRDFDEDGFDELEKEKEKRAEIREKEKKETVSKLMDILTKSRSLEINNFATLDLSEFDIFELKLSNLAHFQPSIFDKDNYTLEKPKKHLKKIPLNYYMRWNYNENEKVTEDLALDKLRRSLGITHKPITMNTNSVMIEDKINRTLKFDINGKVFETNRIDSTNFSFSLKQNIKDNTDKEIEMISILNKISGKYIFKKNFKDLNDNKTKCIYAESDSDSEEKKLKENNSKKTKVLNTFLDKNDTLIDKNKKLNVKSDLNTSYLEQMMSIAKKDESKYLKKKRR